VLWLSCYTAYAVFIVTAGSVGDGWPLRHVFNVDPFGGLGDFSPSRIHFTKIAIDQLLPSTQLNLIVLLLRH